MAGNIEFTLDNGSSDKIFGRKGSVLITALSGGSLGLEVEHGGTFYPTGFTFDEVGLYPVGLIDDSYAYRVTAGAGVTATGVFRLSQ